jgi:HSP20 family protein
MQRIEDNGGPEGGPPRTENAGGIMKAALTRKRFGEDITPWREFDFATNRLRDFMMEPVFPENFFRMPLWAERDEWMPAVELVEKDGEYLLSAELPGIDKKYVDVSVEDKVLTLKGEKKFAEERKEGRAHIRERLYGVFERAFTLPRNVDENKIFAEFHDGIVEVHLPKGEETKARHIDIA